MKQPNEGVTGTDRDDYLLSLAPEATAHRDMLITTAANLHSACRSANPTLYDRMAKPRPGDLVVILDIFWSQDPARRMRGLGILLERRIEWYDTDEEWAAMIAEERALGFEPDEERRTDNATYVQYGPNAVDVCRWVDCTVLALPGEIL